MQIMIILSMFVYLPSCSMSLTEIFYHMAKKLIFYVDEWNCADWADWRNWIHINKVCLDLDQSESLYWQINCPRSLFGHFPMFVRCYIDINCCCCNFNKTEQTERSLETENDSKYKYFNAWSPHAAQTKNF